MKHIHDARGRLVEVQLSKGEQLDLMKRNNLLLKEQSLSLLGAQKQPTLSVVESSLRDLQKHVK